MSLLVDALNHCWSPYVPDEPEMTPAAFKRLIRDRQVWCSSCMVAFLGPDPIGVLIGAKRSSDTLIHTIAIHPDHRRQGHGRHLLTSLSSKLAILGPPRLVAEVPDTSAAACGLFDACGYVQEAMLTDWALQVDDGAVGAGGGFVIPVTIDDLVANDLLAAGAPVCWEHSVETLTARKDEIAGLAIASDERIEACALYIAETATDTGRTEMVTLRSFVKGADAHLRQLVSALRMRGATTLWFPRVHPSAVSRELLEAIGFRPAGRHRLYVGMARSA